VCSKSDLPCFGSEKHGDACASHAKNVPASITVGRPPGLDDYLRSVIAADSQRRGVVPSILRFFFAGCSALYDAGLEGYLTSERAGIRRRDKLPIPVISIGNLTVGGAGKTPLTVALCRRMQADGLRVAILSRGHGGASHEAPRRFRSGRPHSSVRPQRRR